MAHEAIDDWLCMADEIIRKSHDWLRKMKTIEGREPQSNWNPLSSSGRQEK